MENEGEIIDFYKHRVFDRDPFAVDAPPKPHYYPSPERKIKARQKYIEGKALVEKKAEPQANTNDRLSPMDEFFLKGSNVYQSQRHTADMEDEVNFDESWPSSEKPSSLSLSGLEDESPIDIASYRATLDKFAGMKKTSNLVNKENQQSISQQRLRKPGSSNQSHGIGTVRKTETSGSSKIPVKNQKVGKKVTIPNKQKDHQPDTEHGSVLQRYVERFRNSAPMSRDQREKLQNGSAHDFWWMSDKDKAERPSEDISQREIGTGGRKARETIPLTEENLGKHSSLKGERKSSFREWTDSPGHKKTVELQERAEKLLERSSSTVLSTEPAVSTEGLGSTMSDMSSLDEYSYKPPFAKYTEKEHSAKYSADTGGHFSGAKTYVHPTRPDEDPLHQWRLRRRMDQAKEAPPTNVGSFGFTAKTEQQKKIDAKLEEFKQRLAGKEPSHTVRTRPLHEENREEHIVDTDRSETGSHPTLTGRLQFTPAPAQTQKNICDNDYGKDPPAIASPTLHRRREKSHNAQQVDPHLHLMCDLLPCPHQNENREHYSKHDEKSDDHKKTVKTANSYKQYLEAEKPDVEKGVIETRDGEYSGDMDTLRERDEIKYLRKERPHKDRSKYTNEDDVFKGKSFVDAQDQRENICDRSEKLNDGEAKPFDELQRHEMEEKDAVNQEESSRDEGKANVIKPTHSSSPKIGRRTVESAIGQVIKDHLFSTTTSMVLSSVDSLPPSASVTRLDKKQRRDRQTYSADTEDHESDCEFPEDHLLQMLRKQRSHYENQLQQIDQKLKILEDR